MNLEKLFEKQRELDERIVREKSLDEQWLFDNKRLALLVEIGELANETRCFKHWSNKGPSEDNVILEEFVDGVHFFISLAIEFKMAPEGFVVTCDYTMDTLTDSFLELYKRVSEFTTDTELHEAFSLFIGIAEMFLGFTCEQIEQAYMDKNKVNHARQSEGY